MNVDVWGATDIGRLRKENQDAIGFRSHRDGSNGLFILCDGMGGKVGGGVASRIVVDTLLVDEGLRNSPTNDFVACGKELSAALLRASITVLDEAFDRPELSGMKTTATVALLVGSTLIVGQVGDSRGYLLREGWLHRLTEDQTQFQQVLKSGGIPINPDSDFARMARSTLTQSVGGSRLAPELTIVELRDGDTLLMCSDGLYGMVSDGGITHILGSVDTASHAVYALIEAANNKGGHDNIAAVVARFSGEGLESPTPADGNIGYPNCRFPLSALL